MRCWSANFFEDVNVSPTRGPGSDVPTHKHMKTLSAQVIFLLF